MHLLKFNLLCSTSPSFNFFFPISFVCAIEKMCRMKTRPLEFNDSWVLVLTTEHNVGVQGYTQRC